MRKVDVLTLLSIFLWAGTSVIHAQKFSVVDVNLSVLDGVGIDAGYTSEGQYIGFGYSFKGTIPYGENYTEYISYITYPEDIRSIHTNKHLFELKYGELFKSNTLPYLLIGLGWKNKLQQRFDELRILDVDGDYFVTYDDEIIFNIGLGIRQRIAIPETKDKHINLGIESSYQRLFVISIGWARG
jgi:hypothetical protein